MNLNAAFSMRSSPGGVGGIPAVVLQPGTDDLFTPSERSDCFTMQTAKRSRYTMTLLQQYRRTLDVPVQSVIVDPTRLSGPDANGVYIAISGDVSSNNTVTMIGASGASYTAGVSLSWPNVSDVITSWKSGFLGYAFDDSVTSRIAAAGAFADGKRRIYTTQDHATPTYVRNSALWTTELDLTGCSPWNSYEGHLRAGTMVSRRHFIHADHYLIPDGSTIRFVANDNTVHERTVVTTVAVGDYTDIRVGVLNSDLPASIAFYPVLPSNWRTRIPGLLYGGAACIHLDQEEKALVATLQLSGGDSIQYGMAPAAQAEWGEGLIPGDSGDPMFLALGNTLILAATFWSAGAASDLSAYTTEINAAMTALGGGYQLTIADLSAYPIPT
jgi:hypothetical protein